MIAVDRKETDVFEPVMSVLRSKKWGIYGPTSFQGYAKKNGLTVPRTAEYISVDHMERLNSLLRREQAMVLRLGTAVDGPGTQFAVVKTPNRLHDYFLLEEQCFTETHPVTYLPSVSFRNLFPYYIFPKRTETSMVNLAFASGLIGLEPGQAVSCGGAGHWKQHLYLSLLCPFGTSGGTCPHQRSGGD